MSSQASAHCISTSWMWITLNTRILNFPSCLSGEKTNKQTYFCCVVGKKTKVKSQNGLSLHHTSYFSQYFHAVLGSHIFKLTVTVSLQMRNWDQGKWSDLVLIYSCWMSTQTQKLTISFTFQRQLRQHESSFLNWWYVHSYLPNMPLQAHLIMRAL